MKELVIMKDKQAVTSSVQIADSFDKEHYDVIKTINRLEEDVGSFTEMFLEATETDSYGRPRRVFYMNRDGFTLLAMGFTGKKALEFKLQYIKAFNEMEKQLQNRLPGTYREALLQLVEQVEENEILEQRIAEYEPKIDYLSMILSSIDTVTISQIAADYGMSARAMNKLLNDLKVQHKIGGQWILYRKHMQQGYTKSHTTEIPKSDGGTKVVMNTKWTQKGRLFLYNLLKEESYLPQMDLELEEA